MDFLQKIKTSFVLFDGGMGTMLQEKGLQPGEVPETRNITAPDDIIDIHRAYLDAGSCVVSTNTFGANPFKLPDYDKYIRAGVECACEAVCLAKAENPEKDAYVALDIGPLGKLMKPAGELEFEDAVNAFAAMIKAGENGSDLVIIETMNDLYELKAAILAAKENCSLPVVASAVFNEQGKLLTGADSAALVATLEGLGVDVLGTNCSLGPRQLKSIVPEILRYASVPVIVQPNAGLPKVIEGKTVFEVGAEEFAEDVAEIASMGVAAVGGCCGTTPEHISALSEKLKNIKYSAAEYKSNTLVSSYTHVVEIGKEPVLIGERINPTGKPKFKQALRDGNIDYIINEGFAQAEKGVHILDVNVGLPEIDESAVMLESVTKLQASLDLPLQIDTSDAYALEKAARIYNGKPLINSVNGKEESMNAVFPIAKKYGGVIVALTLDENGIPSTAQGRVDIASKIISRAAEFGIDKKNIIVDALTMAVSSDKDGAKVTLETVRRIKEELGVFTCLGVSNVSFGLPERQNINSAFFSAAMTQGLDAAIMNPYSLPMMSAYYSSRALLGYDEGFAKYIEFAGTLTPQETPAATPQLPALQDAIIKGMSDRAAKETEKLLETENALDIIDNHIVPALDFVGTGFEKQKFFLPQLLMSADAAQKAFAVIKEKIPASQADNSKKIVLATVKGDIHDIGKNILRVLLENYGFCVIDLGRDVDESKVVDTVVSSGARLVCLSALMTTTVPSMERTIKLIREKCRDVCVCVGGAVLTQEYADMIGADFYSKDAMTNVRYAENFFKGTDK